MSKNPLFRNGKENEKVIRWNPQAAPDHHQQLINSRGSPLPMDAMFGGRPFPRSSVILFTE